MDKILRYEKMGTSLISVDITDDYAVIAIGKWDIAKKKYLVTLELKEKQHGLKDMIIDETDNIEIQADMKTINVKMAKFIPQKLNERSSITTLTDTIICLDVLKKVMNCLKQRTR